MRLAWYLGSTVLRGVMIALIILLGYDAVSEYVTHHRRGSEAADVLAILRHVCLFLPSRAVEYLPYAAIMGCLGSMGVLARNNELVALQSAGVSRLRIAGLASFPVLLLALLGVAVMQYPAPQLRAMAETHRLERGGEGQGASLWHREGNRFIHLAKVFPDGRRAQDLSIYELDDWNHITRIVHAAEAHYLDAAGWTLYETTTARQGELQFNVQQRAEVPWQTNLTPRLLRLVLSPPEWLSLSENRYYAVQLQQLPDWDIDHIPHLLVFWRALLDPLAILALLAIGMSFIFGFLRSQDIGSRLGIGLIVALVFSFVRDTLSSASLVFHFPPIAAVLLPSLLCLGVGLLLLRRGR